MKLKACFLLLFSFNVFAQETPCQDVYNNYLNIFDYIFYNYEESAEKLCTFLNTVNDNNTSKAIEITEKFSDKEKFEGTPEEFVTSFRKCLDGSYAGKDENKELFKRNSYNSAIKNCNPLSTPLLDEKNDSGKVDSNLSQTSNESDLDPEKKPCQVLSIELEKLTPGKSCPLITKLYIYNSLGEQDFEVVIALSEIYRDVKEYYLKNNFNHSDSANKATLWEALIKNCRDKTWSDTKINAYETLKSYNNECFNEK